MILSYVQTPSIWWHCMLWLKQRASVEPPFVYDSGQPQQSPISEADEDDSDKETPITPSDSSGIIRRGARAQSAGETRGPKGLKRDRSAAGLSDTLRANNADTNSMLRDCEQLKDARHQEMKALKERELKLEEEKLKVVEKGAETAAHTGQGLIAALGDLAKAVIVLANK
ncbi:hypothetical protein KFL_012560020 [Klebsormidium nitens]|uniref:No apical meristem-associated C-terminal domain-containing protein n=1 Tax=Klebsormidium nitens TaxID=105231 RepID=A0A1Y1IQN6_KLENI|nr:hypothetical protein KFL_012560020 [Klebsormidium nitens]|eukprot:GAQ93024.1 hypothetical protein KFL_012560020 [Klebsormidium nitens]